MQSVKFRLWLEDEQHYTTVPALEWRDGKLYVKHVQPQFDHLTQVCPSAVLEMYTGHHDTEGEEIYEGDVYEDSGRRWVIRFGRWRYWDAKMLIPMFGWHRESLLRGSEAGKVPWLQPFVPDGVTIIGNIHIGDPYGDEPIGGEPTEDAQAKS